MNKLVLGIGNPIIGDDGVGFHVIEASSLAVSRRRSHAGERRQRPRNTGPDRGLRRGHNRGRNSDQWGKPGEVCRLELDSFRVSKHVTSPHDVDLPTAMEIGRVAGLKIPQKLSIVP